MNVKSLDELLRNMAEIALRNVEHYLTDFLVYDTSVLYKADSSGEPFNFVWLVRDFGTHLICLDKWDWKVYFNSIWKTFGEDIKGTYLVSKNTLIDITGSYGEVLAEIKRLCGIEAVTV